MEPERTKMGLAIVADGDEFDSEMLHNMYS
jgi:hypothetical protein